MCPETSICGKPRGVGVICHSDYSPVTTAVGAGRRQGREVRGCEQHWGASMESRVRARALSGGEEFESVGRGERQRCLKSIGGCLEGEEVCRNL